MSFATSRGTLMTHEERRRLIEAPLGIHTHGGSYPYGGTGVVDTYYRESHAPKRRTYTSIDPVRSHSSWLRVASE